MTVVDPIRLDLEVFEVFEPVPGFSIQSLFFWGTSAHLGQDGREGGSGRLVELVIVSNLAR